jgi:hypothetical protein
MAYVDDRPTEFIASVVILPYFHADEFSAHYAMDMLKDRLFRPYESTRKRKKHDKSDVSIWAQEVKGPVGKEKKKRPYQQIKDPIGSRSRP